MGATARPRARLAAARRSDTAAAAGLALATAVQQGAAVVFTVVFARVLGTEGYGALAALTNVTVILLVPGSALQVAVARQGTLGRLGGGAALAATLRRWTHRLLLVLLGVLVLAVLARGPLADLVGVDERWAAAAVPATATLWLLLCAQRGLLLAAGAYRVVGATLAVEGAGRILAALALTGAGLGVTGAYLGLGAVFAGLALWAGRHLRATLGPAADAAPAADGRLRAVARTAAVPIAGLVLVAVLQNVDVIMARRALPADSAGVYAATTVAAKAIVWIAVGVGLWVLPETTRRAAAGRDPRGVLVRALAVIAVLTVPALALFAAVPRTILRLAFGDEYVAGDAVLLELGAAYALLAAATVAVQYLLGLHRRGFVALLLVAAVAEPPLLLGAGTPEAFAWRVLVLQAATAIVVLGAAARARQDADPDAPVP